ncbi:hypothetical protein A0257_06685 [Hymenobacter psoromatis]|nr:hypothetical protein A0257_06685 [Hymenobacter psoromatis]
MPAHAHLLRHYHLIQRLQTTRGRAFAFPEIQRYLVEETGVGDFGGYELRTFQRDFSVIAEQYGITIKYDRRLGGYRITATEPELADQRHLLEAVARQEFLRLPQALGQLVQPETRRAQGLEHLRPLLRAAQAGQLVTFQYQKFWEDAAVARTAGSLLLKEFRGRWYVLATMAGSGWLACFGLDRISALRLTTQPFGPPTGFDAAAYYENAFVLFGLTRRSRGKLSCAWSRCRGVICWPTPYTPPNAC